jgi:hypothetical protein
LIFTGAENSNGTGITGFWSLLRNLPMFPEKDWLVYAPADGKILLYYIFWK